MGIMFSGSSLGGVCFPFMLKRLFDSIGFAWAVRSLAALMFGCLVVANFFTRSRLQPPGWSKKRQIFDFPAFKEGVFCVTLVNTLLLVNSGRNVLCLSRFIHPVYIHNNLCDCQRYGDGFSFLSHLNSKRIISIRADRLGIPS